MTYRVFRLQASETPDKGALWEDLGSTALDLGDAPAAALGEAFGRGEYVVLDDSLTIVDFEVT